jgi:hypothetical protein
MITKARLSEMSADRRELNNARMHQNYETGGQAFGCDPLSLGDFQLCNSIAKGKS